MATAVKGIGTYDLNLEKMPRPIQQRLRNLTKAVYPNYSEGKWTAAQNYWNEARNPNSVMKKAEAIPQNVKQIWALTGQLDEDTNIPIQTLKEAMAGYYEGSSVFKELGEQMQALQQNVSAVQMQQGRAAVTLVNRMVERAGSNVSPRTIRAVVQQMIADVWPHVNNSQTQWGRNFNKDSLVPGMTPSAWRGYSDILRSNAQTGAVPEDASDEMKAAGKDASKAAPGLTDIQKMRPLSVGEWFEHQRKLREIEKETDPRSRAQADAIRRRMGTISDPPWAYDRDHLGYGPDY
jgi:hypothetical protein